MQPGAIVRFRDRDWVLLPSNESEIFRLRPLTGAPDEVVEVHRTLAEIMERYLPEECIRISRFPLPSPEAVSDAASAHLLWQAARLTLRDCAAPLRSLGRISIRPRIYQLVPLLMALRLDPVRLFIADDVGVGKTVEALLVARELIDRGEVERMAVLSPPYLCDQWAMELREKFNLDAVVIRSSTISGLERQKPPDRSIYEHYPIQVISIDWVKSDRNRHQFLQFCPELVIVDEVHGAAETGESNRSQQQRHRLLQEIAKDKDRHMILLTATPHSGIESAFRSLLGLLRPEFREWDISSLDEQQRIELARHFVQRTRRDIEHDWEGEYCFPQRHSVDETYTLSDAYKRLFQQTYDFCYEIIRTGEGMEERKRRVRYWAALALLRCVMSSPAAAVAALTNRAREDERIEPDDEPEFSPMVFEQSEEVTDDENPVSPIWRAEEILPEGDRRRLRELAREARNICERRADTKLIRCTEVVQELLRDGFNPIIWCRYVATAEYVAERLRHALGDRVQVIAITGRINDEERRAMIDAISIDRPRVLVATDCLSEGINLQEKFTACMHYDLPWNPNRLEQREGRVDRYGQKASEVRAVRFYGRDNPVDGAVIEVLLDKAREIHRALGTYVPVPEESESVMQAVLNSLFLRRREQQYLQTRFSEDGGLVSEVEQIRRFHESWDRNAERERINRSRFAQRALKPEEVRRELEATDSVLGDPDAVKEFVLNAAQRVGLQIRAERSNPGVFCVDVSDRAVSTLPDAVRYSLPRMRSGEWRISFVSPTPEGAEYVGRNHRFVASMARYLLEEALTRGRGAVASRCGVIRTRAVDVMTTLLLLRVRYLVEIPQRAPLISEEVLVVGYLPHGVVKEPWLSDDHALKLLADAKPDANIPDGEKRELIREALDEIGDWSAGEGRGSWVQEAIWRKIDLRAKELEGSHKRVRRAVRLRVRELKVRPQLPPDLLGILILQPMVGP
ncbi:MAG: DEAD/DEAH box helicase [Methanothrix sp.]|nr:helicase-related protein [Methanothrix sp.]MCX8207856.1 DEAD/DEAH box helicase [Methanothrix sp.]